MVRALAAVLDDDEPRFLHFEDSSCSRLTIVFFGLFSHFLTTLRALSALSRLSVTGTLAFADIDDHSDMMLVGKVVTPVRRA